MSFGTITKTTMGTVGSNFIDLLDPDPRQITLNDIAVGLAGTPRYNGQTLRDWSVADHLIVCDEIYRCLASERSVRFTPAGRLAVIMHDGSEFVSGDNIQPFKAALTALGIRQPYDRMMAGIDAAIYTRIGMPFSRHPEPPFILTGYEDIVHYVDYLALGYESIHHRPSLARGVEAEAREDFKKILTPQFRAHFNPPESLESRDARAERFLHRLVDAVNGAKVRRYATASPLVSP